ncbi:hypothetical protein ABE82_10015 [Paenibacillus peoriae]|nr:hypothetical protein ABE82_10015 [Paenibacillus peoriae]
MDIFFVLSSIDRLPCKHKTKRTIESNLIKSFFYLNMKVGRCMVNDFNAHNFYGIVGGNIEKYRKLQNDSLQSLADKMGVTKKTVHRYERAEIRISIEKLIQVASILNTTVEELTSGILKYDETK